MLAIWSPNPTTIRQIDARAILHYNLVFLDSSGSPPPHLSLVPVPPCAADLLWQAELVQGHNASYIKAQTNCTEDLWQH